MMILHRKIRSTSTGTGTGTGTGTSSDGWKDERMEDVMGKLGSEYRDRTAYFGGSVVSRSQQHWCQLQSVILFGGFGLTSKVFQSDVSLDRLPRIEDTYFNELDNLYDILTS
ncbi:hypothetical protein M0804_015072 [Polistes exclamans]|nr:hypothetical protein M0804_015072 [Polistes exclamans]